MVIMCIFFQRQLLIIVVLLATLFYLWAFISALYFPTIMAHFKSEIGFNSWSVLC